jgi:hypothetical protein
MRVEATKFDAYAAHAVGANIIADRVRGTRRSADAKRLGDASQRDLERLLATLSVSPPAADQTQVPFLFSTIMTRLRRAACRND